MALTIPPYVGQGWTDNSEPDLSAENLNAVDAGITANSAAINAIANAVVNQIVNDPNKIASMAALYAVNQTVTTLNSNLDNYYTKVQVDSKLTGLTVLPDDTLGVNIFPAGVNEKTVYICATKTSAPKTTMEKYIIEVYRDSDFIIQKWYSLWFDVVYYRRCNVTGGWVWGAFKTVDMTTL